MVNKVIGLDIGGVIDERSIPFIKSVVDKCGANNVHIVSTVDDEGRTIARSWFNRHDFFKRAGFISKNVHFCKLRSDKAKICKDFSITHFVDDRLEVLSHLYIAGIKKLFLFNPKYLEVLEFKQYLRYVRVVKGWEQLVEEF